MNSRLTLDAFTETWLSENDNDETMHIDGFMSPVRLDRDTELTGKRYGGDSAFMSTHRT